jgi:hypothetical protein
MARAMNAMTAAVAPLETGAQQLNDAASVMQVALLEEDAGDDCSSRTWGKPARPDIGHQLLGGCRSGLVLSQAP